MLLFSKFSVEFYSNVLLFLQAQFIAQSIGQAFQVAYMEFLKVSKLKLFPFFAKNV
jgi:hypothetical protein